MEIRQAISMYLTAKAYNEPEFKTKFENPNKNLDECVTYITWMMYKRATEGEEKNQSFGVAIPSDDEVFAIAVQYYEDEDLKVDGSDLRNIKIVSAAATSFTDEEKAEMRQEAIKQYQDNVIAEQRKKDEERREKAKKAKEKKPSNPVLVPDTTTEEGEKPATNEKKEEATQLSLF